MANFSSKMDAEIGQFRKRPISVPKWSQKLDTFETVQFPWKLSNFCDHFCAKLSIFAANQSQSIFDEKGRKRVTSSQCFHNPDISNEISSTDASNDQIIININ